MKNKNIEKIIGLSWILDIIFLLSSIMIAHDSKVLIFLFSLSLVVFPFILIVGHLGYYYDLKRKEQGFTLSVWSYLPFLAVNTLVVLLTIGLISSLEKKIISVLIVFVIIILGINVVLMDLIFTNKKDDSLKDFKLLSQTYILSYLSFLLMIGIMIVVTYDYSFI